MNKQKFLDKLTDLVEDTLVKENASAAFTIEDLLEDEDRCAIRLSYDYSDAEYVKDVSDLYRRKKEEDVKVKDLYKDSGIKADVKEFVAEQIRLRQERLAAEPEYDEDEDYDEDYEDEADYEDEYEDDDELDDFEDDPDEDLDEDISMDDRNEGTPDEEESFSPSRSEESDQRVAVDSEKVYIKLALEENDGKPAFVTHTVNMAGHPVTASSIPDQELKLKSLGNFLSLAMGIGDFEGNDGGFYVLTTKDGNFGASIVLNNAAMDEVSEKLESKVLTMVPSSVHEWLVKPGDDLDVEEVEVLEDLIKTINENEVAEEDKLSDSLYVYDVTDHQLYKAADYVAEKTQESDSLEPASDKNVEADDLPFT